MTGPGTAAAPHVPAPPPGPGVVPPFVAPPTDGTTARRWWAIGLAGAAALVLCVAGLFAIGGLVVFSVQTTIDQSRAALTTYLRAIQDEQYGLAYALLCEAQQDRIDQRAFVRQQQQQPVESFTVGEPDLTERIVVPATVTLRNDEVEQRKYVLEPDSTTGEFEVCGQLD